MKNAQRGFIGMIIILIGIIIIGGFGYWWYTNSMNDTDTPAADSQPAAAAGTSATSASVPQTLEGGLVIQDMVVGKGDEAVAGKKLSMHYTGTLADGTVFDSSVARGTPFEFTLGAGQVIPGWEQGIAGMKVGGERKLTIPPALAYGAQAVGPIPANSTLHFEVVLLGITQ